MRRIIRIILFLVIFFGPIAISIAAALANDYNPEKPLYQNVVPGLFGVGGVYKKVTLPPPETVEAAKLRAEIERINAETKAFNAKLQEEAKERAHGHFCMRLGVALLITGGIGFVVLKHYGFEMLGLAGAVGGIGSICYGAIIIKIAGHETAIAIAATATLVIGFAAYFCHGRGIALRQLFRKT